MLGRVQLCYPIGCNNILGAFDDSAGCNVWSGAIVIPSGCNVVLGEINGEDYYTILHKHILH